MRIMKEKKDMLKTAKVDYLQALIPNLNGAYCQQQFLLNFEEETTNKKRENTMLLWIVYVGIIMTENFS